MKKINTPTGFCVLPWVMRYIHNDGGVYLCCISASEIKNFIKDNEGQKLFISDPTFEEKLSQSTQLKNIRQKMLQGEWVPECDSCRKSESLGPLSHRQQKNNEFQGEIPSILAFNLKQASRYPIKVLDLRLSNKCNLRCVMCTPEASHLWSKEWNQIQPPPYQISERELAQYSSSPWTENDQVWDKLWLYKDHLKQIEIAGGEPLLNQDAQIFFDRLHEAGFLQNITLEVITNATIISQQWQNIFKHTKITNIRVSIDGVGPYQELMRTNLKWETFDQNMHFLDQHFEQFHCREMSVNFTLQALNAFQVVPVYRYLSQFKHIRPLPHLSLLESPRYMSVLTLPMDMRKLLVGQWRQLVDEFKGHRSYTAKDGWLIESFERAIKYLEISPVQFDGSAWRQRFARDRELSTGLKQQNPELWLYLISG